MSSYEDALFMDAFWATTYLSPKSIVTPVHQNELQEIRILKSSKQNFGKNKEKRTQKEKRVTGSYSYCDDITFAIQSKIYVLKLNLSRKLECIKRFHQNVTSFLRGKQSIHEKGHWNSSQSNSSYWTDRLEPASSRKDIYLQQEAILTRLEQVLQSKRSQGSVHLASANSQLFNMELHDGQFHSRQNPICVSQSSSSVPSLINGEAGIGLGQSRVLKQQKAGKRRAAFRLKRSSSQLPTGIHPTSSEQKQKLCAVCYTNPPNIVTLPCEHHEICSDCFMEIIYMALKQSQYPLKCVICRQKIEKIRCSRRILLNFIRKNRLQP